MTPTPLPEQGGDGKVMLARDLEGTYRLLNEYVTFCNNHQEELDDGGGNYYTVKPTFNGFKAFVDKKMKDNDE